ncbi:hypothetical protein PIB30_053767 [Stylosanthes scabra]|uniref:Uncharacterized protein n=1 Tax=Stylosanthes scabra TaxID=79078 RepID=A0ABU6UKU6_9FABA|nr:hypothetical protein [Stylosanthes scabra]
MDARVGSCKESLLPQRNYIDFNGSNNNNDHNLCSRMQRILNGLKESWWNLRKMDRSGKRRTMFATKSGLCLALVSLFVYVEQEPLSKYSIWAILTVVVVFEFSVGATLSKGLNRTLGTTLAGGLALVIGELSMLVGKYRELVIVSSIFTAGSNLPFRLLEFALWEPPHGPYCKFNYPWRSYVNVSGALRHCAFMVMAMHGCILSEIQAPPEKRMVFSKELHKVGNEGAKVLRQLGSKVQKMERLSNADILFEVHEAAIQLQTKIDHQSFLLVNYDSWKITRNNKTLDDTSIDIEPSLLVQDSSTIISQSTPSLTRYWSRPHLTLGGDLSEPEFKVNESASSLSLATFASLLIEFVARLQNLVDEFQDLCEKADFKYQSS